MTHFHLPAFLRRATTAAVDGAPRRLGWLERLAQWSDRQPARPHHMASHIF